MSQAGIGAMLHYLGGGSKNDPKKYEGRTITNAYLDEVFNGDSGAMTLEFDDGVKIRIWDDGQSCCESRYITCDDDPKSLVGSKLKDIVVTGSDDSESDYDVHEKVFIEVATDQGHIKFVTHNEHNGYYGGFGLTITEE